MCLVRPGHDPVPRRKSSWSASLHVWGAIGHNFRVLVFLHERVNADYYSGILQKFLFEDEAMEFMKDQRVLMHYGAPAHSSKKTHDMIASHGVEVLPWAPYSPDWNPIENLWSILKRRIESSCFTKAEDLKDEIQRAWFSIPQETINNLCKSFPSRLQRCIEVKGEDCQL